MWEFLLQSIAIMSILNYVQAYLLGITNTNGIQIFFLVVYADLFVKVLSPLQIF